jgi:hypothetical protein
MNLKNLNCDMTCFPFFVDVIYNKCKNVKVFLGHQPIKKWDTFTNELLPTKKHNLTILMKDKAFQLKNFNELNGYLPFAM